MQDENHFKGLKEVGAHFERNFAEGWGLTSGLVLKNLNLRTGWAKLLISKYISVYVYWNSIDQTMEIWNLRIKIAMAWAGTVGATKL